MLLGGGATNGNAFDDYAKKLGAATMAQGHVWNIVRTKFPVVEVERRSDPHYAGRPEKVHASFALWYSKCKLVENIAKYPLKRI